MLLHADSEDSDQTESLLGAQPFCHIVAHMFSLHTFALISCFEK